MTDTSTPVISMNSSWRVFFAVSTLIYCGGLVLWLVAYGNPQNSLHQSALSWAFFTCIGILITIGFAPLADIAAQLLKK